MADMRIGTGGHSPELPKQPSSECQDNIEHTQGVAKKTILERFNGVNINVTSIGEGPGSKKVDNLLGRQTSAATLYFQ